MKKVAVATALAVVFGASALQADFKIGYSSIGIDGGDTQSGFSGGFDAPFTIKDTVRLGFYAGYFAGEDDGGGEAGLLAGYKISPAFAVDLRGGIGWFGDFSGNDKGVSVNYYFTDEWFAQLEHMDKSDYEHSTYNLKADFSKTSFYIGKAF